MLCLQLYEKYYPSVFQNLVVRSPNSSSQLDHQALVLL